MSLVIGTLHGWRSNNGNSATIFIRRRDSPKSLSNEPFGFNYGGNRRLEEFQSCDCQSNQERTGARTWIIYLLPMVNLRKQSHQRRLDEELEYWRNRAGWFDDDVAMAEYNNGVYDKYYNSDGEDNGGGSGLNVFSNAGASGKEKGVLIFKIVAILICLILCFFMFRIIARRFAGDKDKKSKKKSSSSSRSRSKSRSRSRSRSRKRGDYDLMDEEKSRRSARSSRSKSRSRRSSRSRSRARSSKKEKAAPAEPVLV